MVRKLLKGVALTNCIFKEILHKLSVSVFSDYHYCFYSERMQRISGSGNSNSQLWWD